jgi:hypothetical protein
MNNVTPKRGKYKKYMSNGNVKIPSKTFWRNKINSPSSPLINSSKPACKPIEEEILIDNTIQESDLSPEINTHDITTSVINEQSNEILNDLRDDFLADLDSNVENDFDEIGLSNLLNNSEITREELAAACLVAFFNGTITQSSLKDFITLSNITTPGIKLPSSFDGLAKILMGENNVYEYQKKWFCGVCLTTFDKLDDRFQRSCKKCNVKLNMSYYLNIEQQIQKFFSDIDINEIKTPSSAPQCIISDITDGLLYKKLLETQDGSSFKKKEAFSFILNTDGISICKKSKLTIWPWYLTCNELPICKRFAFNNLILAGLKNIRFRCVSRHYF